MAELYPRALGSLFVTSYDKQDYGGGILTRLHTGCLPAVSAVFLNSDPTLLTVG
jgi:hypothetical protein